jgi:hypothetical protein
MEYFDAIVHDAGDTGCQCDACGASSSFERYYRKDATPAGQIYKSSLVDVKLADLPHGIFGRTFINKRPFVVEVNRHIARPRQEATLAHELVHVADELWKLNLSHDQVHNLGVILSTEVEPALAALRSIENKA